MTAELHTLVGAYALDALDEREQVVFEQHLAGCATCSAELVEFRATAARLGEAETATPPPELRESVLAAVRRTPQQRPVVTVVPIARWRRQAPRLLAAATFVVIAGVVGLCVSEHDEKTDGQVQAQQIEEVMTASDRVFSPSRNGDVPVQVVSSPSLDKAVVMVNDLPAIDEEHSYEMWAIDDEGARSLGAMPEATEEGTALVEGLDDATQVAITVEPAGGSPDGEPSSAPIETVDLT